MLLWYFVVIIMFWLTFEGLLLIVWWLLWGGFVVWGWCLFACLLFWGTVCFVLCRVTIVDLVCVFGTLFWWFVFTCWFLFVRFVCCLIWFSFVCGVLVWFWLLVVGVLIAFWFVLVLWFMMIVYLIVEFYFVFFCVCYYYLFALKWMVFVWGCEFVLLVVCVVSWVLALLVWFSCCRVVAFGCYIDLGVCFLWFWLFLDVGLSVLVFWIKWFVCGYIDLRLGLLTWYWFVVFILEFVALLVFSLIIVYCLIVGLIYAWFVVLAFDLFRCLLYGDWCFDWFC